jgi:hypothetical protein
MLFQEGIDAGKLIVPFLFVVGACFLALVAWLIILLTRSKKAPDEQPTQLQQTYQPSNTPSHILAVRRSGTAWEIYVKGQRVTASTVFDPLTRKEALEALRVLARFARSRLQVTAEPLHVKQEVTAAPTHIETPVSGSSATPEIDLTDAPQPQARLTPSSVAGMNLAREIGEIVDELLAETPSLQHHAVDLISAQTEGINFVVDGTVYNEVEDIPIPEIRELIRKATKEWEHR